MQELPHIETEVIECFITESYKKKQKFSVFLVISTYWKNKLQDSFIFITA